MDESELKRRMDAELPAGLNAHIARVVELSESLARRFDLDIALARLMAQAHDLVRALPEAELLTRAEVRVRSGELTISDLDRAQPVLLHGPVGALELRDRLGVDDPRVFDAVWWHTTGHPEYNDEAWAMFVADKVEPHKVERSPVLAEVAALAEQDLREAAAHYIDLQTARANAEGWTIQPQSALTRAALPSPRLASP